MEGPRGSDRRRERVRLQSDFSSRGKRVRGRPWQVGPVPRCLYLWIRGSGRRIRGAVGSLTHVVTGANATMPGVYSRQDLSEGSGRGLECRKVGAQLTLEVGTTEVVDPPAGVYQDDGRSHPRLQFTHLLQRQNVLTFDAALALRFVVRSHSPTSHTWRVSSRRVAGLDVPVPRIVAGSEPPVNPPIREIGLRSGASRWVPS